MWLGPTNGLCGRMQLTNDTGRQLSSRKPEADFLEFFPPVLRWTELESLMGTGLQQTELRRNVCCYGSKPFSNSGPVKEARFGPLHLEEHFKMESAGFYHLTIWPKLYKRSESLEVDRDVFQRVDIPPIKVTLRYAGPQTGMSRR